MNNATHHFLQVKKHNSGLFSSYLDDIEAKEYSGCEYNFNGSKFIQRTAKITPKKIGQFVTLWKRDKESRQTAPFHVEDNIDYVVIICLKNESYGRFLFPKKILIEKGILSSSTKEGKRGFRVYPNWDTPTNKQAIQTQRWQQQYFSTHLRLRTD